MSSNLLSKSLNVIRNEGLFSFLRKVSYRIIRPFLIPYAIIKLKKEMSQVNELEGLVDLAFNFSVDGLNIKPIQIKSEILELLQILAKIKPKTILEIGTANGGTLFLFASVADPRATIISVDLPSSHGGYPEWRIHLYKSFARHRQKIVLIKGDSHDPRTANKVKKILEHRKIDFLFIDGDHSYQGVRADFEMYSPFVRKGGLIAFHDIVPGSPYGVPKFWNTLKNNYKFIEIVEDWNQKDYGIGIIYV